MGGAGVAHPRPERRPDRHIIRPGCGGYALPFPFHRVTCAVSRDDVLSALSARQLEEVERRGRSGGKPSHGSSRIAAGRGAPAAGGAAAETATLSIASEPTCSTGPRERNERILNCRRVFGQRTRHKRRPAKIGRDCAAHIGDQPREQRVMGEPMPLEPASQVFTSARMARSEAAICGLRLRSFRKPARCAMPDA